MSLTINNNTPVTQQQILQQQTAATQSDSDTTPTDAPATSSAGTAATANPAAELVSSKATLTSDLLAVLLQEQTATTASFGSSDPTQTGDGPVSLAGILDAQDVATQSSQDLSDGIGTSPTSDFLSSLTQEQSGASATSSLDAASVAQSAASTSSVMSGIQDLLDQLGA